MNESVVNKLAPRFNAVFQNAPEGAYFNFEVDKEDAWKEYAEALLKEKEHIKGVVICRSMGGHGPYFPKYHYRDANETPNLPDGAVRIKYVSADNPFG